MKSLLDLSVYISLLVQFITGVVGFTGMYINVPKHHMMLKDINALELIVQVVEFIFYIYISLAVLKVSGITPRRYFDWYITTPTMLISTVLFYRYKSELNYLKSKNNITLEDVEEHMKDIRIGNVILEEKKIITWIILANAGMLTFGILGELEIIPLLLSNILGFVCFAISFILLFKYAKDDNESMKLYMFFLIVWTLYGVAQLLPVIPKNLMYNCLDIVAKNFYGLYIFYKILEVRI